jgi:Mn-dependent DtxR family transcriptional regulator
MAKPGPERELNEDNILEFINGAYSPAVGTSDVAEYFNVTGEGARKYLDRLQEGGCVDSRKIGRSKIWWLTDEGEKRIDSIQSSTQ